MVLLQRSSLLLLLLVSVAYAYLVIPVHAQTITVSNLQYPSSVILGGQVTVSFTVSWSGAPYGTDYFLLVGVADSTTNDWVPGTMVSSSPDICNANTQNHLTDCYLQSPESDGSLSVTFSIDSPSTGTHSYESGAEILLYSPDTCYAYSGDFCVEAYNTSNAFDITIINQFTLTVNAPGQVPVTLDGIPQGAGSFALQLSPGTHSISVPDIVQLDSTSRLVFVGWSDGSNQTTRTFDLESNTEITGNYVTQYYVNATTDSTVKSGWYNSGSSVSFTVAPSSWNSYRIFVGGFDGWYYNGQLTSKSVRASLSINGPVVLTDRWNYYPYLPPIIVVAVVCAIVGLVATETIGLSNLKLVKRPKKRTRRSKPKTGTVTPEAEKTETATQAIETTPQTTTEPTPAPAKTTMYCTKCGAVIPRESKFCRECGAKQQME